MLLTISQAIVDTLYDASQHGEIQVYITLYEILYEIGVEVKFHLELVETPKILLFL